MSAGRLFNFDAFDIRQSLCRYGTIRLNGRLPFSFLSPLKVGLGRNGTSRLHAFN